MFFFRTVKIVLFIFICIRPQLSVAQAETLNVEHVQLQAGVSHYLTSEIIQDDNDFLWFGTIFGLVRYDGYEFKSYRYSASDTNSISANIISCMFKDSRGRLWIGTQGGGLNLYQQNGDNFLRFNASTNHPKAISSNEIRSITEDQYHNIWIGTENGLNQILSPLKFPLVFKKYFLDLQNVNSISDNVVRSLDADEAGTLWIGTNNGLNRLYIQEGRFDRYFHFDPDFTFRYPRQAISVIDRISKQQAPISSILNILDMQNSADSFQVKYRSDYLFIGMGEGRHISNGELRDEMFDYAWLENLNNHKKIAEMKYRSSLFAGGAQKNRIYIKTLSLEPGPYRLRYISDDSHSPLHWNNYAPDKSQWYGVQLYAITALQKKQLEELLSQKIQEHPNSLSDNIITKIKHTKNPERMWIGTYNGGLNRLDLNSNTFYSYRPQERDKNCLPGNQVTSIFLDGPNSMWLGTENGLSYFDTSKETFNNYKHMDDELRSLSSDHISAILRDRSGILWVGTNMGTIEKISNFLPYFKNYQIQQNFGSSTTLNNFLALYAADSNSVWLGTGGAGLFRYDISTSKAIRYIVNKNSQNVLDANMIRAIIPDDISNLWVGTLGNGLTRLNINTGYSQQYFHNSKEPGSLSSNYILSLYKDSRGRIWVGTDGEGVNLMKQDKINFIRFQHRPRDRGSLAGNTIYTFLEDKQGVIWAGGCNGLSHYDELKQQFYSHIPSSNMVTRASTFCIYDLLLDWEKNKAFLWLATSNGLLQYYISSGRFQTFPQATAGENEAIVGIQKCSKGNLWLSTYKGLIRFNPDQKQSRWFGSDDGLQSNMFNLNAHTQLTNGDILFGGINGFNRITHQEVEENHFQPRLQITNFIVQGNAKPIAYDQQGNPYVELNYWENFFSIHFAALDYRKPSNNRFRYRLKGVDPEWVSLRQGHSVSYTNIRPGKYVFELFGTNSNGVWNNQKRTFNILIVPPFWSTTWFRIILALLFIGALAGLIYYIRFKEKKRTALNQKISELKLQALRSRMNPHFIFNTINAIQYFISENASKEAYFYLSKFSKLLRSTLNTSEHSVIPLAKELEILDLYFALQKLRFEQKLDYSIQIEPQIEASKIGVPSMLIQPYIENAIEHGIPFSKQHGTVSVTIRQKDSALFCTIEDNGIGIKKSLQDKDETSTHYASKGMQLTRERLRIINESISQNIDVDITDLSDLNEKSHGTRVTIHIPFKPL